MEKQVTLVKAGALLRLTPRHTSGASSREWSDWLKRFKVE
jgi:hypothetical protein